MGRGWKIERLGELVEFKTGKLDSNAAVPDGTYPFFTCSQETLRTNTCSFDTECVLLAGNNANGIYPLKYFNGKFDAYQRTYVITTRDPSRLVTRFLYYSLRPKLSEFRSVSTGAATKFLTLTILKETEIAVPPPPIQRHITGILSAYDDLIENNLRRIRILEEMARALYREWFVHFRTPGHETVSRVTSLLGPIPQGWEVREMQEVADVIDCLHSKKPTECADGPGVLLQLNNIGEAGKLDLQEQFRISAEDYARWTSRIELQAGDCVITNVGRIGAVAQIPEGVRVAPGRNMTAVRPRVGQLTPTYLIEYLLSSHMTSEVSRKKDLGTIMDSLNVKGIIRLSVPCPPIGVMNRFESVARPMRKRIELLIKQTQNLRRTRNLLLPRLLSGSVPMAVVETNVMQEAS